MERRYADDGSRANVPGRRGVVSPVTIVYQEVVDVVRRLRGAAPHFGVPEEEHEVRQAVVLRADGRREGDGVLCYARERDECAAQRVGPEREQPTPYAEQGGELWNPRLHGHLPGRGVGVDVGGVGDALRGRPGAGGDDAGADAGEDSEQPVRRVPDLEHGDGEADEGGEVERRVHGLAAEDWSWIRETDLEEVGVDPFLERGLRQQLLVGHGRAWHPVPDHVPLERERHEWKWRERRLECLRQVRSREFAWSPCDQEVPADVLHLVHEQVL